MLKEYLAELQKTPLLSREEETELWQRYAGGDQEAYNKLMTSYQPLVFKTAARTAADGACSGGHAWAFGGGRAL